MTTAVAAPPVWSVRPSEPGDAAAVVGLFEESFGKPATEAWYRWKVLESPWPMASPMAWVAVAGDRIVGHYGGTAMRFRLGGEQLRVVHACDAMTLPDYRRQGILTALATTANAAWAAAGAGFVIGLPTAAWGSRAAEVGYRRTFELGWLWRPLALTGLLPRSALRALAGMRTMPAGEAGGARAMNPSHAQAVEVRGVTVETVERPGPEFDRLWERLRNAYDATVVRDRQWVEYRYAGASIGRYSLLLARRHGDPVGYLAYRLVTADARRSGWIVDLFSAPYDPPVTAALLAAACKRLRAAGAHDVRAFAAAGTPLRRCLRRAGFVGRRGTYDVSVIPLTGAVPPDVLTDPTRWLFAAGDSDVL